MDCGVQRWPIGTNEEQDRSRTLVWSLSRSDRELPHQKDEQRIVRPPQRAVEKVRHHQAKCLAHRTRSVNLTEDTPRPVAEGPPIPSREA